MNAVATSTKRATSAATGLAKQTKKVAQNLTGSQRAARLFLQRMAQFAVLLPTFATLNRALQGSVKFLFEFDSALRDIVRIDISGLSGRMAEVGKSALATAQAFGVSAIEVLETTRVFKQAGFTIEESQKKAQAAILATQVSTLNSAQAVEVFISSAKQFGAQGQDSIAVLDKLARVEDLAAVGASDVAEAFKAGGNALATFSKDLDDSVGVISALREQSRKSGREIGTFLKTIQTRIFAAGDARSALEALGVTVENLDGSLRPTLPVLNDLKEAFNGLTEAQRANAGKAIAGIRQFESLLATLNSLDRANELSAASSEAAGTANEKRAITDQKLERQLGRLKAAGEDLAASVGEAGLSDALRDSLKFATDLLGVFKGMSDVVSTLGSSLAPLLALTGARVVRAVTGLGKGAVGGRGGAGAEARGLGELSTSAKLAANSLNTIGATGNQATASMRSSLALRSSEQNSTKRNLVLLSQMTTEQRNNIIALQNSTKFQRLSTRAGAAVGRAARSERGRFVGLTAAALAAPAAINFFTAQMVKAGTITEEAAGAIDASVSRTVGLGLAFSTLGAKAGLAAAGMSLAAAAGGQLGDFFANRKIEESLAPERKRQFSLGAIGDGTNKNLQENLVTALSNASDGAAVDFGKVFAEVAGRGAGKSFAEFNVKSVAKPGGVFKDSAEALGSLQNALTDTSEQGDAARTALLRMAEDMGKIENPESLEAFNAALESDAPRNASRNIGLFFEAMGFAGQETERVAQEVAALNERLSRSFDAFQDMQEVVEGITSLQTLNREIEMLEVGAKFTADKFALMRNEAMLLGEAADVAEQNFASTVAALSRAADLSKEEGGFGIGVVKGDDGKFQSGTDRANKVIALVLKETEKSGLAAFQSIKTKLDEIVGGDKDLQAFANEFVKAQRQRLEARRDASKAELSVGEALFATRKTLLDEEEKAVTAAADAAARLNEQLLQFGTSVTSGDLAGLGGVGTGDIEGILSGEAGGLSEGVRQLIVSAFGDGVQKAEQELASISEQAARDLDTLSTRLSEVRTELSGLTNAQEGTTDGIRKARLEIEAESIARDQENATLEGGLAVAEARLGLLKAQKDAEEAATVAEKKRLDAVEDLTQASVDFENAIKDAATAFDDFTSQRLSDLFQEEASAQEELKSAQQDVLASTGELADAYAALQQAILSFNGAVAEAQLESNLLAREIAIMSGGITTFQGSLQSLESSFNDVLSNANISLEQRISLERQLAEETLSFLANAREQIVGAGLQIFGQSGSENQELQQGLAGLQLVAEQLGGSFANFLDLDPSSFQEAQASLLSLPQEFRQQILSALSFLPDTTSVGGFSVDQLREAIGQVGAGVAPDEGLPSIEELNTQQVAQLQKLQDLAAQDANLQISQVIAALRQVEVAEENLDVAQIAQERAEENLGAVRDAILEESAVLVAAEAQREALTERAIAATDAAALRQVESDARLFAEQNAAFAEVGQAIVQGLGQVIGARLGQIGATGALADLHSGYIPNAANGLNVREAAGLLRAGMREKKAMPAGAGLAVANTSEAVIPMHGGHVPNYAQGSDIAASLNSLRGIDASFVAAVSSAIQRSLGTVAGGGNEEQFARIISVLEEVRSGISSIDESSTSIQSTNSTIATRADSGGTTTGTSATDVNINVSTNQRSTVQVAGLENLRIALEEGLQSAAMEQVEEVVSPLTEQIEAVLQVLAERGLITGFGQPG
jgi:TP901 family phage tail tape measure protein